MLVMIMNILGTPPGGDSVLRLLGLHKSWAHTEMEAQG